MSAMGLPPLPEGATWGDDPAAKPAAKPATTLPPLPKGAVMADAPAQAAPSLTQRFFANLGHEATGGTNQAILRNQEDTMIRQLRANGFTERADWYEQQRAQRDIAAGIEYENLPGWNQGSRLQRVLQGGAALSGALAGDITNVVTNPTKVITEIPGLGPLASRIFAPVVERAAPIVSKVLPGAVQRTLAAGGHQAAVALPADLYEQGLKVGSGMQQHYDPQQTLMAPATGFALGSTLHGGSELFNRLVGGRTVPNAANVNDVAAEPPPATVVQPQPLALAPPPGGLSEWQMRRAQENVNAPRGNVNTAPDERFTVPPDRQPQTIDQAIQQRQAQDAFDLAQRQRERITPTTVDVQTAGRPEGVQPQSIILNEGFPVQELSRAQVDVNGKPVTMVKVQRYDPRTGAAVEGAQPYEVPADRLQSASYSVEPRAAQEFVRRAEGPPAPEQPRAPAQPVAREPAQTFRATEPDPNTQFPGAKPGVEGRGPIPPQPEGPHPGPERPRAEEDYIRDFGQRREAGPSSDRAYRPGDENASTMARPPGTDGRYGVDDRGFVASDKGGPVKFSDQKQAAKWILNEGHKKSPDQIFEIENHPSGQGFTVRERGRTQAQPKGEVVPATSPDGAGSGGGGATARGEGGKVPPGKPSPAPERESLRTAREDVSAVRNPQPQGPKPKPPARETLFQAIKRLGGIKDTPEVRAVMTDYPGNRGKNQFMHAKGRSPDDIRLALQEEGWFGHHEGMGGAGARGMTPGDDLQALYDAIETEAQKKRGTGFIHPDDVQAVADHAAAVEAHSIGTAHIDAEMSRAGVTPEDTDAQAAEKLAAYRDAEDAAYQDYLDKLDEQHGGLSENLADELRGDGYGHDYGQEANQPEGQDTAPEPGAAESGAGEGAAQSEPASSGAGEAGDEPGRQSHAGANDRASESADRPDNESRGRDTSSGPEPQADQAQPRRGAEPEQTRVEGTEHEADAAEMKRRADQRRAEEKQQNPRAYKDKPQKKADEGLFADQSEKNQADMFAGEPKAKEKVEATRATQQKFYSNPVGDPEMWRELGRTLVDTWGWAGDEARLWANNIQHSWRLVRKDLEAGRIGGLLDLGKKHFYTSDGEMRAIGAKHKSQTFIDGADLFHAKSGDLTGKVTKEDYFQAQQNKNREWGNRISKALKPFDRMTVEERENAGKQITKLVQNPSQIAAKLGTPIGDAAAQITKVLKEVHTYLREAGVDVGEVKDGYFPRVEDVMAIMKDGEGFKRQATKAYQANGMNLKDAQAAAEATYNRVMNGDIGAQNPNNSVSVFTQSRTWTKEADDIMRDYLLQHPADVLAGYIQRATKKAEFARRLGKRDINAKVPEGEDAAKWRDDPQGKLKDMLARLEKEGNGNLQANFVDMIRTITGDFATVSGAHGGAQRVAQLGRTYVALTHMSKATLTAMSEPGVAAIQTGNTIDMLRAYGETVRQWVPVLRKMGDGEYLRGFAEDAGFVGDGIDGTTMMDRMSGGGNTSAFLQKTTNNYFRHTGLTQITEATRVASLKIGMVFLRRLAKDITGNTAFAGIARKLMADAGIGAETMGGKSVDEFARWLSGLDKKATVRDVRAHGDFGKAYESALGRFVNRSVQHPNGALKPYLASKHPLGSLIYGLQSFNQSYTKNVLQRVARMSWEGIKNKDLTIQERLYCQMGMVNLAALTGVTYAMSEARDALFADPAREGDPEMSGAKKAGRAASRAGLTGMLDPLFNFATGAKWTGTIVDALAGPAAGDVARAAGDIKDVGQQAYNEATDEDYEPPDTNTLDRRLATDAYNLGVQPALMGAMGAAAPTLGITGTLVGAGLNYGLSHPKARAAFVDRLGGEKE